MKYMCKTCQKPCSDMVEHIKKVHGFSESNIKATLKTNSNFYKHCFEKIEKLSLQVKIKPFSLRVYISYRAFFMIIEILSQIL